MQSALLSLLSVSVLVYAGFGTLLYTSQRSLLYHPTPEIDAPTEQLRINSGQESLKIWRVNAGQPRAIIYFGGNAEDVHWKADFFTRGFENATIYLVNYRGYGGSTGVPSEQGLYADAVSVYDAVAPEHDAIDVIGRSLGTGVATYLAKERNVERLALITPYDSIENVASRRYPIFPVSLLLKDKYPSIDYVDELEANTLLIVAGRDDVIPPVHAESLAAAFPPARVQVRMIDSATHHSIHEAPEYRALLEEFL